MIRDSCHQPVGSATGWCRVTREPRHSAYVIRDSSQAWSARGWVNQPRASTHAESRPVWPALRVPNAGESCSHADLALFSTSAASPSNFNAHPRFFHAVAAPIAPQAARLAAKAARREAKAGTLAATAASRDAQAASRNAQAVMPAAKAATRPAQAARTAAEARNIPAAAPRTHAAAGRMGTRTWHVPQAARRAD